MPVAILQFAGEVLDGSVSMYSYEKSGLQFRSLLLTDHDTSLQHRPQGLHGP